MNTQDFFEKLKQEEKENNYVILEKIQAVGQNPEAVYAIAQEIGVTDSFEVFQSEMTKQYAAITAELSEEELLAVAGGLSETTGNIIMGTCTGVGVVAGCAGAAAGF